MSKRTIMRIVAIALVITSVIAIYIPAFALEQGDIARTSKAARLRRKPDQTSEAIAYLSSGYQVTILATGIPSQNAKDKPKTWYWVETTVDGVRKVGYIRQDFLKGMQYSYENRYGADYVVFGLTRTTSSDRLPYIAEDMIKWRNRIVATTDPYFDNDNIISSLSGTIFTQKWDTAVRRFQQKNGLSVDGLIGPKTKAKLWSLTH